MDCSPFLKEILDQLVTPRVTLSSPPTQKAIVDKLLSASDGDLTNRSGSQAGCLRSLLLLQAGEFERSHSIVQEMTGADAAYIHGMIHRAEGDYSNAKYWFRKALADPVHQQTPIDPIQVTEAVAKSDDRGPSVVMRARLVCRLAYNDDVAAGQLAVFQGAVCAVSKRAKRDASPCRAFLRWRLCGDARFTLLRLLPSPEIPP
jgi:hypothetical protein